MRNYLNETRSAERDPLREAIDARRTHGIYAPLLHKRLWDALPASAKRDTLASLGETFQDENIVGVQICGYEFVPVPGDWRTFHEIRVYQAPFLIARTPERYGHILENFCFENAILFCSEMSAATGLRVSIPTQEQWLTAVRGAQPTIYFWGDSWGKRPSFEGIQNQLGIKFDYRSCAWEWTLAGDTFDGKELARAEERFGINGPGFFGSLDRGLRRRTASRGLCKTENREVGGIELDAGWSLSPVIS